jgi:hypothetical protein
MCQYRDAGPGVRLVLQTNICAIGVLPVLPLYFNLNMPKYWSNLPLEEPPSPPPPHRKRTIQRLTVSKRHKNFEYMGLFLCLSQLMEAGGQKLGWEYKCVCATGEQAFCLYDNTVYINPPPHTNESSDTTCSVCPLLFSSGLPFNLSFFLREFFFVIILKMCYLH